MKHRKKVKKPKAQYPDREKPRFCDPAACNHCEYIGDGTFVCNRKATDSIGVVVVSGWKPTVKYLHCKRRNNNRRERR